MAAQKTLEFDALLSATEAAEPSVGSLLAASVVAAAGYVSAVPSEASLSAGGDAGGGGDDGGGNSFAASRIASPPFGQKSHARHLHQAQWNFLNFSLQNAWH